MNAEINASRRIFQIINKHLAEPDGCKHNLREVLKEAFVYEGKGEQEGRGPTNAASRKEMTRKPSRRKGTIIEMRLEAGCSE